LDTVTETALLVLLLPAASNAVAFHVWLPAVASPAFQVSEYGALGDDAKRAPSR
jgi:hypothetical protein